MLDEKTLLLLPKEYQRPVAILIIKSIVTIRDQLQYAHHSIKNSVQNESVELGMAETLQRKVSDLIEVDIKLLAIDDIQKRAFQRSDYTAVTSYMNIETDVLLEQAASALRLIQVKMKSTESITKAMSLSEQQRFVATAILISDIVEEIHQNMGVFYNSVK